VNFVMIVAGCHLVNVSLKISWMTSGRGNHQSVRCVAASRPGLFCPVMAWLALPHRGAVCFARSWPGLATASGGHAAEKRRSN
jgi:hypothetical protein